MLHVIALRVGVPVYQIEAEMPASELVDWILFFKEERKAHEPPSVEDLGAEGFAASLGADVEGLGHGS